MAAPSLMRCALSLIGAMQGGLADVGLTRGQRVGVLAGNVAAAAWCVRERRPTQVGSA